MVEWLLMSWANLVNVCFPFCPIEKCRRINKLLAMKCRGIVTVKKKRVRCVTNFWFWRLGALWGLCLQTKYWLKSFVIPCMEYHKDYKMLLLTLDAINLAREYSQLSWSTVKYWQNNFSERANLPRIYLLLKDMNSLSFIFQKKSYTFSRSLASITKPFSRYNFV